MINILYIQISFIGFGWVFKKCVFGVLGLKNLLESDSLIACQAIWSWETETGLLSVGGSTDVDNELCGM